MPLFAQLFSSVFTAFAAFLLQFFASKVAVRVAAIAAVVALGTALLVLFNLAVAPFVLAMFSTNFGQLLGLVFPPVAGTVVAAIITLWGACLTYRLQVRAIAITATI